MSLLRRVEGARPGQPEQPQQPGSPQQPPKSPAEGPLSQSTAPARDAQRDVRSRLQSRIINNLDPRLDLSDAKRSEEHTSELQSHSDLVCRLLLEKKKNDTNSMR